MEFMEKLLDGVEVEWKPLSDIASITIGEFVHKNKQDSNAKYPVYNGGISPTGYYEKYNNTGDKIIVSARGANAGFVNRISQPYWAGNSCYSVGAKNSAEINWTYIFYFLKNSENKLIGDQQKGGIPAVSKKQMEVFQIPIPCPDNPKKSLEIQAEIVRILDAFTAMTAELTAELNLRKKQYNHYRDQLLSFEEGEVEWKTLPEMALDFGRGKSKHRPRNDARLYGGHIPFIQTGDIRSASHIITRFNQTYSELGLRQSKLWPKGTLCITIAVNIAETSILGFDACFPDSVIGFVADPKKTNSGYVEYLLQSIKRKLEEKGREKSSAQSNINLATFEQLKLPFPSLVEQARIVAILDKFDTLTTSITEGLPREIELRQQQYGYYRDLLLSFPTSPADGPKPSKQVA